VGEGRASPRDEDRRWVLLAYHLPREPSTPRITLWRKLKRLGAVQVLDGLVGLPYTARTQEHMEWLADEVLEAGGESSVWLAEPLALALERDLVTRATEAAAVEYRAVVTAALAAAQESESLRRRALARLRRELHRIGERDYFLPPERDTAHAAVDALASRWEAPAWSG
jgi:hypothetical protein